MKKKVTIVDYGSGNIFSAQQSFIKVANDNNIKANVMITNQAKNIAESTHIVLPGQGAFETCMKGLSSIPHMISELTKSVIHNKTPFLGICVGMQLLANTSYENGEHKGLGWIDGQTNQTVVFYYNHETKSSTVIEKLPGAAPGTPTFACIISGGKDYFISKKFLEQQLGDAI